MKAMKKSLLGAAVCAALGYSAAAQAGVVIDLFADPVGGSQSVSTGIIGDIDSNQTGPFALTNVLGGYRDLSIEKVAQAGGVPGGVAKLAVGGGFLSYSNESFVTSTGVVTWDGSSAAGDGGTNVDIDGLGGLDLTAGGSASQFFTSVLRADLGFQYKITVWDMDGDRSTLAAGVQFGITNPGGVGVGYLFNWFNLGPGQYCNGSPYSPPPDTCNPATELDFTITRSGSGAIDFTRIGAIQLTLEGGTADVDLTIGSVGTVPEPGALALVGVALLGAGIASRRRIASKA